MPSGSSLPPVLEDRFVTNLFSKQIISTDHLCTLPEPSPFASFSTSSDVTLLKSPSIVCFRQLAATANSSASLSDPNLFRPADNEFRMRIESCRPEIDICTFALPQGDGDFFHIRILFEQSVTQTFIGFRIEFSALDITVTL